jgi:hypothetical protein
MGAAPQAEAPSQAEAAAPSQEARAEVSVEGQVMVQNYWVEKYLDDRDPVIQQRRADCPHCAGTCEQWRGNPPLNDVCAWCAWSDQLRVKKIQGLI